MWNISTKSVLKKNLRDTPKNCNFLVEPNTLQDKVYCEGIYCYLKEGQKQQDDKIRPNLQLAQLPFLIVELIIWKQQQQTHMKHVRQLS